MRLLVPGSEGPPARRRMRTRSFRRFPARRTVCIAQPEIARDDARVDGRTGVAFPEILLDDASDSRKNQPVALLRPAVFVAMLGFAWAFLREQPSVDADRVRASLPTLGAHTLLGQEDDNAVSPAITSAITTQATGSSFLIFSAGYASNNEPPTDNKSNTWKPLGEPAIYRGYDERFDVKAYVALNGKGGANHTISIVKNGTAIGELTLPFIEIRNADVLQDVARNYPPAGTTLTSEAVTTTGPATLIAVWWGDAPSKDNSAEPRDGFKVIERFTKLPPDSAVQCVVAYKDVDAAGTYSVRWTNSPPQGAPLWLLAFQSNREAGAATSP